MTTQCSWCIAAGRIEQLPDVSHTICDECLEERYPEEES